MQSIEATPWVRQGYEHYAPNSKGQCPFCQQHLPSDFEAQITECFDKKYSNDCAKIAGFQKAYAEYTASVIAAIRQIIETLKTCPSGFGSVGDYEKSLALLEKTVLENNQRIAAKVANPAEVVQIDSIRAVLAAINALVADTNAKITKNNDALDNKTRELSAIMTEVFEHLAFELKNVVSLFRQDDKDIDAKILSQTTLVGSQQAPITALRAEITRLTKKLGGSAPTIELVNALLDRVGFRGFSLKAHPTVPDRYQVVRDDGTPATLLSEGERNFIAFLYFYHLVKGSWKQEDLLKGKIVVIDDPVSSMDSGVLAIVGSLVRELIDDCFLDGAKYNIKQIFILTHNPYFHNAVSQQMLRPDEAYFKKVAFFEIKKNDDNISSISKPCVQKSSSKDPDIEYENVTSVLNAYSALWQEYKDAKHPSTLLHIINRIVDYQFLQLCSYDREELRSRIRTHIGSDTIKLNLIDEMLHHIYEKTTPADSVGTEIYYPAVNDAADYRAALRTVYVAMGQDAHYAKMSSEG